MIIKNNKHRYELFVILVKAIRVVMETPAMASNQERTRLDVLPGWCCVFATLVAFDDEQVVPSVGAGVDGRHG